MNFRPFAAGSLAAALSFAFALSGCVVAEEEPEPLPVVEGAKRVFASSQQVTGDLGGLAGADAQCASWAAAASLGGSWKAYLSAEDTDAIDRIAEAGPWYNVNRQTKVFNNKTGFTVGAIAAIRTEYDGNASGDAWTGTTAAGEADAVHCEGWTNGSGTAYASVGTPSATLSSGAAWMAKGGNAPACGGARRVYCFEQ